MLMRRRSGFTLIELLVVIAIIGILAAMVFPVFARARESARKAVCLSNVKNIALALQMYFSDYNDTTPPGEHDANAIAYFSEVGAKPVGGPCTYQQEVNPYLRWPLILDEYTKNRDVWRCPSSKIDQGPGVIVPGYYPGGWLGWEQANEDQWYNSGSGKTTPWNIGCIPTWPPGWGGDVTDTFVQQLAGASSTRAFVWSIWPNLHYDLKLASIDDTVNYVALADGPIGNFITPATLAYPDLCALGCAGPQCWEPDPSCPQPSAVGCAATWEMRGDPELRKPGARHLGGSNIGFMDGHAAWWRAERILSESPRYRDGGFSGPLVERKLQGLTQVVFPYPTTAGGGGSVPEGTNPDPTCPQGGLLY